MEHVTVWPGWVRTLRLTLTSGVATVALMAVPAQAQTARIDVPAGPLAAGLNRLADQTGLQIDLDGAAVAGLKTRGISGAYTPGAAIEALLAGTGLEPRFSSPGVVAVVATQSTAPDTAPEATEAAAPDAGSGTFTLAPIVIEGEKLPRDQFRTYSSVSVVTGQEIDDFAIQTLDQALDRLPNVTAQPNAQGDNQISIRGLNAEGVTQPSRGAPIISVIVDGAPQGIESIRRGSRGVWDVQQIEVLRGPQSTIQGRNALGGAVVVETNDPTYDPEVTALLEAGNQEQFSGAFAVSGPIVEDQVAFRIAGQLSRLENDITYTDVALAELGEDEFEEIRGKLLFEPNAIPDLAALFTVSYTHDKPGWNAVTGPDFFERVFSDPTNTSAEFRDTTVARYVADLKYDLSAGWSINSITAYSDTDVEIDSPPGSTFDRSDTRDVSDLSQDLQLTYSSPDSPFSGVFGFFAGSFETDIDSDISTDALAGFGIPEAAVQDLKAKNETTNFAVYADVRYEFLDRWAIFGGGRVLREKVSADFDGEALDLAATEEAIFTCFFLGCVPEPVYGSLDEDNSTTNTVFLPKAGIAFDITDSQTIAATASRGYRAGFSEAIPGSTEINRVDPEYLWSYELAWRSRWWQDRLDVNANAFYYDYSNQQILTLNPDFPGQTITENSGESHAYGMELEARVRPIEPLELFASVGLLKTEFDEAMTLEGDFAGNEFPESPSVTAAFGGVYRHFSGVFAAADVTFTGGYYSFGDLANTDFRQIDSFTLVNAQLGYDFDWGTVALFARNLLNEEYLTSIGPTGTEATIGDGRFYGLRVQASF